MKVPYSQEDPVTLNSCQRRARNFICALWTTAHGHHTVHSSDPCTIQRCWSQTVVALSPTAIFDASSAASNRWTEAMTWAASASVTIMSARRTKFPIKRASSMTCLNILHVKHLALTRARHLTFRLPGSQEGTGSRGLPLAFVSQYYRKDGLNLLLMRFTLLSPASLL